MFHWNLLKEKLFAGEVLEELENCTIEGETVQTETVKRGSESFYHTQYNIETKETFRLSAEEIHALRTDVENQLSRWHEVTLPDIPY